MIDQHNAMVFIRDHEVEQAYNLLRDIMQDEYVAIGSPDIKPDNGQTKEK